MPVLALCFLVGRERLVNLEYHLLRGSAFHLLPDKVYSQNAVESSQYKASFDAHADIAKDIVAAIDGSLFVKLTMVQGRTC